MTREVLISKNDYDVKKNHSIIMLKITTHNTTNTKSHHVLYILNGTFFVTYFFSPDVRIGGRHFCSPPRVLSTYETSSSKGTGGRYVFWDSLPTRPLYNEKTNTMRYYSQRWKPKQAIVDNIRQNNVQQGGDFIVSGFAPRDKLTFFYHKFQCRPDD